MKKIIEETLIEIHDDFGENPFEWCVNEIEGHVRFYNALKPKIRGLMNVTRSGKADSPIPSYENIKVSRVLLEYPIKDKEGNTKKPDICVYKKDFENRPEWPEEAMDDILDAFIEIKATWGYNKNHMDGGGIEKDFKFLNNHPEIGHIVYFIGNDYEEQKKKIVDWENEKSQIDMYKEYIQKNTTHLKNIYLVFRDKIVNGEFKEV